MIEQYPGNSNKQKPNARPTPEAVVEGRVIVRKPNVFARLRRLFVLDDPSTIGAWLVGEVVLPAVRDLVFDSITGAASRSLYGGDSRFRPSTTKPAVGGAGKVSYNSISSGRPAQPRGANEPPEDIVIENRGDAQMILDTLREYASLYGHATRADFYALSGATPPNAFIENAWGWTAEDLYRTAIRHVQGGYILTLPRPVSMS